MFEDFKKFETEIAGRPFVVEVGKMAQLAGGSCLVRYGETDVLCTATMAAKPREGVDFFPLSVDLKRSSIPLARFPVRSSAVRAERARRQLLHRELSTDPSVLCSPRT